MAHSKEVVDKIIKLKGEGKTSREVALEVLGKVSSKSTVNDIYNRHSESVEDIEDLTKGEPIEETLEEPQQVFVNDDEDYIAEETLEGLCESEDFDLSSLAKRLRTAQKSLARERKISRGTFDTEELFEEFLQGMKGACNTIAKVKPVTLKTTSKGKRLTAEILLSDYQIGKLMTNYNTEIAFKRMKEYSDVVISKIKQHIENGYKFDRIVLAMLGDIIESDEKHSNSGRACDTSTAEQIKNSVEALFVHMVKPLAELGIPMDCICITGNHDWNGHGLSMFKSGRNQLSYPLYHAVKMITEASGYNHVKFVIPDGVFHVDSIYGFNVLYEHGVGVSAAEASMSKRRQQRSEQLRKHITYFRVGDKHNISRFNEDTLVVNGAFFGGDTEGSEYSSICGYASDPAQLVIFHTPRTDDRLSVYDSLIVQLKHIK